ncbi:helix-turn-helix transcriptional regulator [Streptomyces sp. BPTC-684]|uniref:helix-turn-helix domain-containing protein n=1 Tax=Streptomyces sp. BPTC-684 TaxID=3043734 RepID=UPI0024B1F3F6|nr:helix-turn-helix transcriptional regulator [Streptomyces sp. BPTC-684]WHM37400.1 helix-turn-helix transcriptional regulator [Streptomyces sp. BPTC-684]
MELEPDDAKPATPAALLASRAARARRNSGLSLRLLGEKVGYPHTYLSRVERGEQLPSVQLAEALDEFYELDGLMAELLVVVMSGEVPTYGQKVLDVETRAARIQTFNSSVIPGLLQIETYTSALFKESMPGKDAEKVALLVAKRMHRRAVLETKTPPFYWAIVDEAAFRRPIGGPAIMSEQIRHIADTIEANSNVRVQVLPFKHGVHPLLGGSLSLLTLRDGLTFAYVESFASGTSIEDPAEVLELTTLFDIARERALDSGASLVLMRKYLKEYEDETEA